MQSSQTSLPCYGLLTRWGDLSSIVHFSFTGALVLPLQPLYMILVDNSRSHSVPCHLFLFLWFPSHCCVSRPSFWLYPFFPTLPTLRALIYSLHGCAHDLTVKMKPLEFPAIWHANAEITQFIWKIPCKCFHKKICWNFWLKNCTKITEIRSFDKKSNPTEFNRFYVWNIKRKDGEISWQHLT